jgi:hypothetical protein
MNRARDTIRDTRPATENEWGRVVGDVPLFQCPHCGAPTDNPREALMHCVPSVGDRP